MIPHERRKHTNKRKTKATVSNSEPSSPVQQEVYNGILISETLMKIHMQSTAKGYLRATGTLQHGRTLKNEIAFPFLHTFPKIQPRLPEKGGNCKLRVQQPAFTDGECHVPLCSSSEIAIASNTND